MQLQDGEAALCSIVLALGSGFEAASCKPGLSSAEQRLLKLQTIWLYYRAIWHLKDAAKRPQLLQSDGILATTKLVQIYEMYFGQGFQGNSRSDASRYASIEAHFRGQIALMSNRGPRSFTSGRAHDLFTDYRLYATVSTIFVRTTLSINEGEWRTVPWLFSSKDPKDILTDILHDIVSLLKRLNQLRASGSTERRDGLLLEAAGVKRALRLWFSDLPADAKVFDYTTTPSLPSEVTSDRQLSLLYLVTLYWCACILIDTTIGFLELLATDQSRQPSVEAGRQRTCKVYEVATTPARETNKCSDGAHIDYDGAEMGVLDASKCHAYKIAHTMHLMRGPRVGICFYSMCVVPISIAFSLLTALEPASQMSEERQVLSSALASHALYNCVAQFAVETEDPMARLEHEKARRIRWWTKC